MNTANLEVRSDRVIGAVKRHLAETLGDNLREVILFGSRSRFLWRKPRILNANATSRCSAIFVRKGLSYELVS